ncbi:MAG: hypothetical protein KC493_02750 [Bacteriovoracaceae bacterium]|nr:hypothetical protein [Bacteriovoracaceae bacterium]
MKMRKLSSAICSVVVLQSLLSPALFAADSIDLSQIEAKLPVTGMSSDSQTSIDALFSSYKPYREKPKACPLESNNHKEILSKIENIRNLFKDNCMDQDQARLDALLTGAQDIQTSLNDMGVAADDNDTVNSLVNGDIPTGDGSSVSGTQIASVFNNINNIFLNGKCKLNKGSFLEQTADIIQSFAQMGLLVPNSNGLVIAGGGLALSSILKAIDSIFSDRFNFEEIKDRQTFIKLNCAFYDLRQDIQNAGLMDVGTDQHDEDLKKVKDLVKKVEAKIKAVTTNKTNIEKSIEKAKGEHIEKTLDGLAPLEGSLKKALSSVQAPVADTNGVPATTIKLKTINSLARLYMTMKVQLESYFDSGLNSIPIMDNMLKQELSKLDFAVNSYQFETLIKMDVKEFNSTFRANLLFHFERVLGDISASRDVITKKWMKETLIHGKDIATYLKDMTKRVSETQKKLTASQKSLTVTGTRLSRALGEADFSSSDDGSENVVNILSQYEDIASQVYGKWGYEFMDYTTQTAVKKDKDFKKKFKKFADNHLDRVVLDNGRTEYLVRHPSELSELRIMFACQDAMPFRRVYKYADGLVQQGYDFIETNKRLFHADVPNGLFGIRSKFRLLQMHHKSSIYAKKLIAGSAVTPSQYERYIEGHYGTKRKKYLGAVMIGVNNSRAKAGVLQKLIEAYQCDKVTMEETN